MLTTIEDQPLSEAPGCDNSHNAKDLRLARRRKGLRHEAKCPEEFAPLQIAIQRGPPHEANPGDVHLIARALRA